MVVVTKKDLKLRRHLPVLILYLLLVALQRSAVENRTQ